MNKINNKITKRFWIASAFRLAMTRKTGQRPVKRKQMNSEF
jgi:hypothetical protein